MLGHSPMRSISGQIPSPAAPAAPRVMSSGTAGANMGAVPTIPAPAPAAAPAAPGGAAADAGVPGVAAQMQSMHVGAPRSATGRQANPLLNAVLGQQPVNMADLDMPPPPIQLPPGTGLSPAAGNADPSYQRSTLNAVPTTASMLNKSKLPLSLIHI